VSMQGRDLSLALRAPGVSVRATPLPDALARIGASDSLTLVMSPGEILEARVTDERGRALPNALARVWCSGSTSPGRIPVPDCTRRTDVNGRARLSLTTLRRAVVLLVDHPGAGSWAAILSGGRTGTVAVKLPSERQQLSGKIVCRALEQLSSILVVLAPADSPWVGAFPPECCPSTRAKKDGTFRLTDVPANLVYRCTARAAVPYRS